MADTVNTHLISNSDKYVVYHFTNYSDGTGESGALKIDKSTLTTKSAAGADIEPAALDIVGCRWNVQGFTSVRVQWRHTANHDALVLSGSGQDFFQIENAAPLYYGEFGLNDPRTSPGANDGDILFTTTGAAAGNSYDITLICAKRKT